MCGIAGFYTYKDGAAPNEQRLTPLLESIRYRGPDHLGVFLDRELVMGCVRLSILDVEDRANQPIYNEDRSVAVVYNGEIYNFPDLKTNLESKGHVFETNADTEVLVHLYEEKGIGLADELNGMFAFALFDRTRRRLILGRDRTGQKPLYIHRTARGIVFCSELKAMLPYLDERKLEPSALVHYLSLGYSLEPETVVQGVEALEPGTLLIIGEGEERKERFWAPQLDREPEITTQNQWEAEADDVLRRAVRRHVLSDVPLTLFLSGGVDSSLLALYAAEERCIRKVYTGSFIDGAGHDEYGYAQGIARLCGFRIERVQLSRQMLAAAVEPLISESALPPGDTSTPAAYCLAKEAANEYRVVLGGDGGDELFGGYPTYALVGLMRKCGWIPSSAMRLAHSVARTFSNREGYMPLSFKLQQLSLAWKLPTCDAHYQIKNFLPSQLAKLILDKDLVNARCVSQETPACFRELYGDAGCTDDVKQLRWIDFRTFLLSGTIPKMERQCMKFSLENRLPYLDNEVIDLSLRTDSLLMVSGMETKKCLRKMLRKKIGCNVDINPIKQGFTPPTASLLRNELKEWRDDWLAQPCKYFARNTSEVLNRWRNDGWDTHRLEWHICTLKHWCYRNHIQ